MPLLAPSEVSVLWHSNRLSERIMPICSHIFHTRQVKTPWGSSSKGQDSRGRHGQEEISTSPTHQAHVYHLPQSRHCRRRLRHNLPQLRCCRRRLRHYFPRSRFRRRRLRHFQLMSITFDFTFPEHGIFEFRMRPGDHRPPRGGSMHLPNFGCSGWVRGETPCYVSIKMSKDFPVARTKTSNTYHVH